MMLRVRIAGACACSALGFAAAAPLHAQDTPPDRVNVTVQGSKVRPPAGPRDRSVASNVIEAERLKGAGMQAQDALRGQPGLNVVETGGQGALATASIRGATAAQTPVYLGGVRINDDVAGTADLSTVPLWLIERIEVYRGNAPIDADQLGIGGAVFFEPRRARRTGAGAGATYGSFGSKGGWGWAGAGGPQSSVLLGARYVEADNNYTFMDDRGTRFVGEDDIVRRRTNADVQTTDVWAVGRLELGERGTGDLLASAIRRDQGVPGLALLPTRSARASMQRSLMSARLQTACADSDRCTLTASSAAVIAGSSLIDPELELALGTARLDMQGARTEHSLGARIDLHDRFTITPQVRAAAEQLRIDAWGGQDRATRRISSRAAVGAELRASRLLTVRLLGSAECHGTSDRQAVFCNQVQPSGRIGLQVGSGALVGLANVGRYVRNPTLGELYGVSGVVRGNDALEPERGTSVDAGIRLTARRGAVVRGAFADLFAFVRQADDLIAWRRSSMGYVRPYNVGSARVAGIEWLGAVEAMDLLRLELAATLIDPRDTTASRTATNDLLPLRSRLVLSPLVQLHTHAFRRMGIDRASIGARYVYQSSRYADEAGLVVIPAQGLLDLEAEVRTLQDRLAIRARVANALDQRRFDVIGYALATRALHTTAELAW